MMHRRHRSAREWRLLLSPSARHTAGGIGGRHELWSERPHGKRATSNETSNGRSRTRQHEPPLNRTNTAQETGQNSTNEHAMDWAGLAGQPYIELRIWSGNRLEVESSRPHSVLTSTYTLTCVNTKGKSTRSLVEGRT